MAPHLPVVRVSCRLPHLVILIAAAVWCAPCQPCAAAVKVERPFVLWNKHDIAQIRRLIETEPWAKAVYQQHLQKGDPRDREADIFEILQFAVMNDQQAGARMKAKLLDMVRSPVPQGGAQEFNVVRYDMLYDQLTEGERREVEQCFRKYIEMSIFTNAVFDKSIFNDSRNYSRYDARKYTRSNWLPNIIWPRKVSANLMAAAIGDEALIRKAWSSYGSWQWYFDEYLGDLGFYSEEFSKMGATPGVMLIYCRAVERLGLDELGYGYRGKHGATMRGHLESILRLGYPRIDLDSARPQYPMVTLGDLRQSGSSQPDQLPTLAFQHSMVRGYLANGRGGTPRWITHGAWGGTRRGNSPQWDGNLTPKMLMPLWFEVAQQKWPDAGFAHFLAQMRSPDEDKYYPSLYFGLRPIDPAAVKPPAAPSGVYPQRGLVMLRADESPAYWESAAPAVAMRLAANYAHNVCDSFALAGLYAFNRPIYINRQPARTYAQGFSRSVLSHCGVMVDGRDPGFTSEVTTRHGFYEPVKFVAARSQAVFEGIDQTRALLLTRQYMLDVHQLAGDKEHSFLWLVHTLGEADLGRRQWSPPQKLPERLSEFGDGRGLSTDGDWSVTAQQTCQKQQGYEPQLPGAWYQRRIGVRMTMLGQPGTTAYVARTPTSDKPEEASKPELNEVGGVSIIASRSGRQTAFVALHVPLQDDKPQITQVRRIAQSEQAVAVKVAGEPGTGVDDRLMLRIGNQSDQPTTISGDGEEFTFADHAFVRIGPQQVEAWGDLKAMKVRCEGKQSKLILNGKPAAAQLRDGCLLFDVK